MFWDNYNYVPIDTMDSVVKTVYDFGSASLTTGIFEYIQMKNFVYKVPIKSGENTIRLRAYNFINGIKVYDKKKLLKYITLRIGGYINLLTVYRDDNDCFNFKELFDNIIFLYPKSLPFHDIELILYSYNTDYPVIDTLNDFEVYLDYMEFNTDNHIIHKFERTLVESGYDILFNGYFYRVKCGMFWKMHSFGELPYEDKLVCIKKAQIKMFYKYLFSLCINELLQCYHKIKLNFYRCLDEIEDMNMIVYI